MISDTKKASGAIIISRTEDEAAWDAVLNNPENIETLRLLVEEIKEQVKREYFGEPALFRGTNGSH